MARTLSDLQYDIHALTERERTELLRSRISELDGPVK
jgi:hypothetical protein